MDAERLDKLLARARSPDQRVAWFGALLAKETRLAESLVVVGGSAIEIYTEGRYVSQDIDLVGDKRRIVPVLRKWGFKEQQGRDRRTYWVRAPIGLIDLVGTARRSGLEPSTFQTRHGPIKVGPVEDLIVRRLMRAGREHSTKLFDEATLLATRFNDTLDWDYIETEAKFERVSPLLRQLRARVGTNVG